ncbi:hypothetical protein V2J09_016619 [Rumex salicifolius]
MKSEFLGFVLNFAALESCKELAAWLILCGRHLCSLLSRALFHKSETKIYAGNVLGDKFEPVRLDEEKMRLDRRQQEDEVSVHPPQQANNKFKERRLRSGQEF